MNAKLLVQSFVRILSLSESEHQPDKAVAELQLSELRHQVYENSRSIWITRTAANRKQVFARALTQASVVDVETALAARGEALDTTLHLNAPMRIYREMMIPYNAVRVGLRNAGFNPDDIGLTESFLFDDAIDRVLDEQRDDFQNRKETYSFPHARQQLNALLVTLSEIGISGDALKMKAIVELLSELETAELVPVKEYVDLVKEAVSLRQRIETGVFNRKTEERLVAVSRYLHHTEPSMTTFLRGLSSEKREAIIGGPSLYEFNQVVYAAKRRYEMTADRERREQREAEERKLREEEERQRAEEAAEQELWRQVAIVECRHRYGHDNAAINNDWYGDGHFYSGPDQLEWGIPPDDHGDPGLQVLQAGDQRCLCHWHKLDDRYIPRTYTKSKAA